ncbi:urea ABC transporter substrate-binding protein [Candidatus Berkiella aquae]|uniref:Aliphatic amidase expression-regulating protein n=1 Tax=Candidatus Berkiella aquae TaxID=295108 RepID=A0A0Q9Z1G3_9GAMM|nr:urea ABC transporter substrate-binding protein [Candidatus Berkiella aquae]MCS5712407.1 urea ABC transporter substrate-binding protein [Candidatus Berkiella aquae]
MSTYSIAIIIFLSVCVCILATILWFRIKKPPIRVGILHSLTGTMAFSAASVADATLMAIDEINESGGILGRKIKPIIADGRSDPNHFIEMAEKLITKDKVCVVFGCWSSANRKAIKPVFEKYNHLLIYPIQYEGLEDSPNIIYTGATPNQQIIPAIKWSFDHIGKRFFLVGSDYVFSRAANEIIKDQIKALGGKILGEAYIPLGNDTVNHIVDNIQQTKPDMIVNTINGDSNIHFFKRLRMQGISPSVIPSISFSLGENELCTLSYSQMAGDYAAWNYFQNIPNKVNQNFVENYKNKYGQDRVTDDPIESGYIGVFLWAQAVKTASTTNVNTVREAMRNQYYFAPEGTVYIDAENNHTWKVARIGKIRQDGQFDVVWRSDKAIKPLPYPDYRTKEEWEMLLDQLYKEWGNHWVKQ